MQRLRCRALGGNRKAKCLRRAVEHCDVVRTRELLEQQVGIEWKAVYLTEAAKRPKKIAGDQRVLAFIRFHFSLTYFLLLGPQRELVDPTSAVKSFTRRVSQRQSRGF